jgi:hypothetical protein
MSYILRTLSIRDVGRALQRREVRLALRISQNLCSNTVGTVRSHLRKRPHLPVRPATGRNS